MDLVVVIEAVGVLGSRGGLGVVRPGRWRGA